MKNEDNNEDGLIDIIGQIAELYDIGKTLEDFFDPPGSLDDMFALLLVDISNIFLQDIANEDLKTATATLQSVQNFFAIDYADAVNNKQSDQQLYTLLTQDNAAPSVSNFDTIISLIASWAQEFSPDPSQIRQNIACQAITFSLTSYLYLVLLYKERARVYYTASTNPGDRQAGIATEWANMQKYALNGITTLQPIFNAITSFRFNSVSNTPGQQSYEGGGVGDIVSFITFADNYLGTTIRIQTDDLSVGYGGQYDTNYQDTGTIGDFLHAYMNVLKNGTVNNGQPAADLNAAYNYPLFFNHIDPDNTSNVDFTTLPFFGDFYTNSQVIFNTLTSISTEVCTYS